MADIVFNYEGMTNAVSQIQELAAQYKSAATTLDSDFSGAVSNWEGESKNKMVSFVSGPVMEYARETVPNLLNSLAELLKANAEQMQNADQQIADSIPTSLG